MCHRYKLDSLNWKICFIHDKLLKFYSYSYENMQSDGIYVSLGIG